MDARVDRTTAGHLAQQLWSLVRFGYWPSYRGTHLSQSADVAGDLCAGRCAVGLEN